MIETRKSVTDTLDDAQSEAGQQVGLSTFCSLHLKSSTYQLSRYKLVRQTDEILFAFEISLNTSHRLTAVSCNGTHVCAWHSKALIPDHSSAARP